MRIGDSFIGEGSKRVFLSKLFVQQTETIGISGIQEKFKEPTPPPSAETALRPRAIFSADHEPGRRGVGGGGGPGRRVVAVGVGRRDVGVAARQRRRADAVVDAQHRLVHVRLRGRPGRVVEHGRRRVVCGVVHGRVRPAGVAVRRRPAGRGRTRVAEVVPPRGGRRRRRRRRRRWLVDRLGRRAAVARRTPGGDAGGRAHGQAAGPGGRRHAVAAVPAPQTPAAGRPVRVRGVLTEVRQRGAAVAARPPGPRPRRPPVPGLPAGGLRQTLLVGPAPGRALGPPPGDGLAGPGRRAAAANVRAVRLAGRERHVAVPARARGAQNGRAVHVRRVRADVRRRRVAGPARPAQPRVRVPRAPAAAPLRRVRPSQQRRTPAAEAPIAPLNASLRIITCTVCYMCINVTILLCIVSRTGYVPAPCTACGRVRGGNHRPLTKFSDRCIAAAVLK